MNGKLKEMIKRHEGFRRYAYKDSLGILTIGYGFNLDHWFAYGINPEEAEALLLAKITIARREASQIPGWHNCNEPRQAALIDMVYCMGLRRTLGFKKMSAALVRKDFEEAATQILDSRFAKQTGDRAKELARIMRTGDWRSENGD